MDKKQTEALRIATESLPMLKIAASLGDETGQISFHSSHLLNLIEGYVAARQEIASLKAQPYDQQAMGLCHVCGWKGVIDYPDGPVCVACEHDKTLSPQPTAQAQHPDDAAVEKLAESMKQKLAEKRAQGRSGWDTDCTQQRLSDLLRQHVEKGDVLDVANFCAFLFARGERVSAAQAATATLQEKETND